MSSRRFTLEDLQRKGFAVEGDKAAKGNRKVLNAQKQEVNGIAYGSKLELYMYNLLTATKIPFLFQVPYLVQEGFKYQGKKVQDIHLIVDFYLPDHKIICDTKGHQTPDNKLKWKVFKRKLQLEGREERIELPATKQECEALINELLSTKKIPANI